MSKNTFSGALLVFCMCALPALVLSGGAAGAQNSNSGTTGHAVHGGTMTADSKFVLEAALGGQAEVELGRLAAQKGATDEVRQFGQRMVNDHSKANEELMRVASSKGWTPPTALDAKHQAELQKMSALSGEKFDKEYVKMMLKDHRKDVAAFEKEASGGADADVKAFAAATLPTLREHLQMIQRISDKMALRKSGNLKTMNANTQ